MPATDPTVSYKHFYTDAPPLHRSAVLATLQILAWLFFHPTAWRHHIARVDPSLRPDFCISQLSMAQLHNPALRRLLLLGHGMGPLLVTLPLSFDGQRPGIRSAAPTLGEHNAAYGLAPLDPQRPVPHESGGSATSDQRNGTQT